MRVQIQVRQKAGQKDQFARNLSKNSYPGEGGIGSEKLAMAAQESQQGPWCSDFRAETLEWESPLSKPLDLLKEPRTRISPVPFGRRCRNPEHLSGLFQAETGKKPQLD